jgi:hypothetical protein
MRTPPRWPQGYEQWPPDQMLNPTKAAAFP